MNIVVVDRERDQTMALSSIPGPPPQDAAAPAGEMTHPSAIAYSAISLVPPGEEQKARERVEDALLSCEYEQAVSFVVCPENKERIRKWGPQRVFVPHRTAVVGSAEPLILSETILKINRSKIFTVFSLICIVASIALLVSASMKFVPDAYYWHAQYPAMLCLVVPFGLNLATYSRSIAMELLKGFEFWYLSLQLASMSAAICYTLYLERGDVHFIPFRLITDLTAGATLLLMDASTSPRTHKGAVHVCATIGLAGYAYLWSQDPSVAANEQFSLYFVKMSAKTVCVSTMSTLAMFSAKNVFLALIRRHDSMMLKFSPRLVKLTQVSLVPDPGEGGPAENDTITPSVAEEGTPRRARGSSFAFNKKKFNNYSVLRPRANTVAVGEVGPPGGEVNELEQPLVSPPGAEAALHGRDDIQQELLSINHAGDAQAPERETGENPTATTTAATSAGTPSPLRISTGNVCPPNQTAAAPNGRTRANTTIGQGVVDPFANSLDSNLCASPTRVLRQGRRRSVVDPFASSVDSNASPTLPLRPNQTAAAGEVNESGASGQPWNEGHGSGGDGGKESRLKVSCVPPLPPPPSVLRRAQTYSAGPTASSTKTDNAPRNTFQAPLKKEDFGML